MKGENRQLLDDTNHSEAIVVIVGLSLLFVTHKILQDYFFFDFSTFMIIIPVMVGLFFVMLIFYSFSRQHEI